jgi:hypothetical protein
MAMIAGVDDIPRISNVRTQQIALWTTGVSLVILLIAYAAFPGFWPPMSPQLSADQVATFYRDHTALIRFSMVTFNLFGVMLLPMFGVIVVQMKRITTQNQVFTARPHRRGRTGFRIRQDVCWRGIDANARGNCEPR